MNPATSNQYINKGCLWTYECMCENIVSILKLNNLKQSSLEPLNTEIYVLKQISDTILGSYMW